MSTKYKFTLNEEARQYAEQLGETDSVRESCIEEIRKYLQENPKLNAKQDDYSILVFLRGCKFDLKKTKQKICNYYQMRTKVPEWFHNRNPNLKEIDELVQLGVFVPITSELGPLIVIIRTGAHDPSRHKQSDVFKTGKMILDLAMRANESATIYGVYAIFDMADVTFAHAQQLPPSVIRKAVHAWQNYHCRPQLLDFVNAPVYINVVLNIFRMFMNRKLRERVHVHYSGFEDLHRVIPARLLPEEYGGSNGPLKNFIQYWREQMVANYEWFQEDEKYKAELE